MKVVRPVTIVEIQDDERSMLKCILCIAAELGNNAVRDEVLSGILTRAGLDNPYQAGLMRVFAESLGEEL